MSINKAAYRGFILMLLEEPCDSLDCLHPLADIGKASRALGVAAGTVTSSGFLFRHDPLHDQGAAVFGEIIFDVLPGIDKAVTDRVGVLGL
jgi:hypothetical protein